MVNKPREPRTEGRLIRKALLESERWLTLKDNADRLAYISLLLHCDDYGNYSAELYRLMRMWRDFGITSTALVAKTLSELADHDLIGMYEIDERPFLHVQRLHNTRQWWVRIYPQSPFDGDKDNDKKQWLNRKSINDVLVTTKRGVRGKGLGVRGCSLIKDNTLVPSADALDTATEVKPIITIPLSDGSEWPVTQEYADEMASLYPAVDVPQTLREIRAWNLAKPKNRKTKSGIKTHINSWLAKEQNRG